MRSFVRVNHKIRVPKVRCVKEDGTMLGVVTTREAMEMAITAGLDLVEISPNADPPVCRIMDFGKYRYDEHLKEKKARKQAKVHNRPVKEVKFHVNIGDHDYQTKVNHTREFLQKGHKVKISLQFRGRESIHKELGFEVMDRVMKDCVNEGVVDMDPKLIGRSIIAMLGTKSLK